MKNNDSRCEDFTLSCALQDDGSMTFAQYSADGFAYEGNNGGIFTFKIKANEDAVPGQYEVGLSDMVLSIDGVGYEQTNCSSTLKITNGTDGINAIDIESLGNARIYTLDGKRISLPKKGSMLKPGMYIIDGRKVVVK